MTTFSTFDLEEIRAEKAERGKKSLAYFFRQAWPVLEPGVPLRWNWHLDAIFEHLQAVISGQINRLVVNLAPGHAKSTIFSVALPAWTWTFLPTSRWLCASHSLDLAVRDNNNCRALIESDWYQSHFGNIVQMKPDQNEKGYFENTQRGYRLCTSVGSKGTGKRGSHLMIDDPNDSKATQADIEETKKWFGRTWLSRLNDMLIGTMIVVGQRIHEQDLTGHIRQLGGWECLSLPSEYEPSRKCFTSLGWSDPRTVEGELLWPEKFPKEVLNTLKQGLGSINYAAQYQQSPVPSEGGQFKEKWLRYFRKTRNAYILETSYGQRSVLKSDCWRFSVVDLAISSKQTADYTVIQTYDVTPQNDLLLIHQIRDRLDNPSQKKIIRWIYTTFKPRFFKVETIGYQLALFQDLRDTPAKMRDFLIQAGNPQGVDETFQRMQNVEAFLMKNEYGDYVEYDGYSVARVMSEHVDYWKFACEHQGYCRVYRELSPSEHIFSIPLREYRPVKDKVSRASTAAIQMENEKLFFPHPEDELFVHDLVREVLMFPKGANDDQVDGLSMGADEIVSPHGPVMWSPDDPTPTQPPTKEDGTPYQVLEIEKVPEHDDEEWEETGVWSDYELGDAA